MNTEHLKNTKLTDVVHVDRQTATLMKSAKVQTNCVVGIEIELENVLMQDAEFCASPTFNKYWNMVNDGSLRGGAGIEFVLNKPRSGAGISTALTAFDKLIRDLPSPPKTSQSTSTHIHLDMTNNSVYDIVKFIFLYRVFENSLLSYCGEFRVNNLYCLSFQEANLPFKQLASVLNDPRWIQNFSMDYNKYGACNLATLGRYGSLEFRSKGGVTTSQEVFDWINLLTSIKMFADNLESFEDILALCSREQEGILDTVFGARAELLAPHFSMDDLWEACMDIQYVINAAEDQ